MRCYRLLPLLLSVVFFCASSAPAQKQSHEIPLQTASAPFEQQDDQEIPEPTDPAVELLASMTLRQKIGQLFMIRPDQLISSIQDETIRDSTAYGVKELNAELLEVLDRYPAGGFALFGKNIESPDQVRDFTAQLKQTGPVLPFIAVDEEGGDVARLANHNGFDLPRVGTMESIGATGDSNEAYSAASQIGQYLSDQ